MRLRDEIAEQPAVVARLLQAGNDQIAVVADTIAGRLASGRIDHVVIAARGTSDNAALYAQYLIGVKLGLTVALAAPSLLSIYHAGMDFRRALVLGISQSGRSPDVVGVVASARSQGAMTIALTNDLGSDLAAAAEHQIDLRCGPERSVAATKTYTASIAAIAMLVVAIGSRDGQALAALPEALAAAQSHDREGEADAAGRHLAGAMRILAIGRGYEYATAREAALKLKELGRVSADAYSSADLLHGPIVLAEPGLPVLAITPAGPTGPDMDAVLERLAAIGCDRVVITDRPEALARATIGLTLPAGIPDWMMPIVSIVPAQLLALSVARANGLDPETPRYIEKVTLTN